MKYWYHPDYNLLTSKTDLLFHRMLPELTRLPELEADAEEPTNLKARN